MKEPKEKAQELYDMFSDFGDIEYECGYVSKKYSQAVIKQACIFACEEAIRSWRSTSKYDSPMVQYYQSVIKEIELL